MIARLRYILRLAVAFASRFKVLLLSGILLGIASFFLLGLIFPSKSREKIGITGRYTPTTLPTSILGMVGQGLTRLEEDGNVVPDLASSWETTDKGKTWTFYLKGGASWQDGKPVTSSGISYAFSDVEITRPDAQTIIFKLQNPYSAFPSIVSRPTFKTGLLGSGEWKVKNLSLAGSFVDEITISHPKKGIKIYRFYPTEEQTKLAFKLGKIDNIEGIFDPKPIDSWPLLNETKEVETGGYVAVFLNTTNDKLADKSLRQALAYAVDKETLGGTRAIGPISVDSWAFNPQVKPYDYDPKKAKSMIDEIKDAQNTEVLTVNLNATPTLLSQAESIKKNWEEAGLVVNLVVAGTIPNDFEALLAIFDTPEDPDQYSMWHSTQISTNITRYSNPRIDKLLEDGRTEINKETRKQIYFDFQRYLVEDSPAVFLFYPTTYNIERK
ncbi:MAG TPA: ABC transporter substrate-binding protein [Patescibacteria group bacterium]|nr:ABC transporter substrate-binding protein [Patescibacteria group bacterium]